MSDPITVDLSDTQTHLRLDRPALAGIVRRVLADAGITRAAISLAVVDDARIHEVNRRHLGHDWATDVITFRLSDPGAAELEAELIVSAEMAAATARDAGTDPHAELALYVVHGLLHLCGYDDRSADSARVMRQAESDALARLGLPNTFGTVGPAEEEPRCPA